MNAAALVGNLWRAYNVQLERRPIRTQMTTSALLWCSGDIIAQRLELWDASQARQRAAAAAAGTQQARGRKAAAAVPGAPPPGLAAVPGADGGGSIDWRRALLTGLFGATFVGPVGHFWYSALDAWCARLLPGGGPAFIGTKVLLDTAAMGPFYVAAFFAWGCAFIDRSGAGEFKRKMAVDFVPTLAAEASVWPLVQAVNFSVVPVKHQLLVINVITIIDAAFMSWARGQEDWVAKALALLRRGTGGGDKQQLQMLPLLPGGGGDGGKAA